MRFFRVTIFIELDFGGFLRFLGPFGVVGLFGGGGLHGSVFLGFSGGILVGSRFFSSRCLIFGERIFGGEFATCEIIIKSLDGL